MTDPVHCAVSPFGLDIPIALVCRLYSSRLEDRPGGFEHKGTNLTLNIDCGAMLGQASSSWNVGGAEMHRVEVRGTRNRFPSLDHGLAKAFGNFDQRFDAASMPDQYFLHCV